MFHSSSPARKLTQSFYDDSNLVRKKPRHESKGSSTARSAHSHHKFVVKDLEEIYPFKSLEDVFREALNVPDGSQSCILIETFLLHQS